MGPGTEKVAAAVEPERAQQRIVYAAGRRRGKEHRRQCLENPLTASGVYYTKESRHD